MRLKTNARRNSEYLPFVKADNSGRWLKHFTYDPEAGTLIQRSINTTAADFYRIGRNRYSRMKIAAEMFYGVQLPHGCRIDAVDGDSRNVRPSNMRIGSVIMQQINLLRAGAANPEAPATEPVAENRGRRVVVLDPARSRRPSNEGLATKTRTSAPVTIYLERPMFELFRAECRRRNITQSRMVSQLLEEHLMELATRPSDGQ